MRSYRMWEINKQMSPLQPLPDTFPNVAETILSHQQHRTDPSDDGVSAICLVCGVGVLDVM